MSIDRLYDWGEQNVANTPAASSRKGIAEGDGDNYKGWWAAQATEVILCFL
ncbi:hypothetical protein ACT691_09730 [Vibrio metschnikovii]